MLPVTRMKLAKDGIITNEIRTIARMEGLDVQDVGHRVAEGSIVIIRNRRRKVKPLAIGSATRIKINANIGTSSSKASIKEEIEKMKVAIQMGADAIMDLSTGGDITAIRKTILKKCPTVVGTVPIYEMAMVAEVKKKSILELSADEMFEVIERHCAQGVDFLTIHCGVTKSSVERFKRSSRVGGVVSRGGAIMMEWLERNGKENPLYSDFGRLLEILARYDVALSLGDGFRPGSLKDATDRPQIEELVILGELVKIARDNNVGVFVEGPGHIPLHQVAANMQIQKTLCDNAPFYVLGPLVTDISPGYDHITGAIGGAVAAMAGADFLCYVTPAEHLRLPSVEDVREGVIASRIAAHAADIARGNPKAIQWDYQISKAKMELNWEKLISLCVDPPKARAYRRSLPPTNAIDACSICGEFCAIKRTRGLTCTIKK